MLISKGFREKSFLFKPKCFWSLGFLLGVFCYEYPVLSLSSLKTERVVYCMFSEFLVCRMLSTTFERLWVELGQSSLGGCAFNRRGVLERKEADPLEAAAL